MNGQSYDSRRRNPLQVLANLAKLVASAACWILSRTLALVNSALGGNAIRLTFTLRCLQASHAVRYPGLRISELGAPAIEAIVVTKNQAESRRGGKDVTGLPKLMIAEYRGRKSSDRGKRIPIRVNADPLSTFMPSTFCDHIYRYTSDDALPTYGRST